MAEELQSLRDEFVKLISSYPEDSDLHGYRFEDFLALSEQDLADFKARATFKHRGGFARLHAEGRAARESREVKKSEVSPIVSPHAHVSQYAEQLQALDGELAEICAAFHASDSRPSSAFPSAALTVRATRIRELCEAKQHSVTVILTRILNDKKLTLPYLKTPKNIPRPKGLQVGRVLDRSAEGLVLAARLANKAFKQAVRQLAAEVGVPSERVMFGPVKTLAGISRKLGDSKKKEPEEDGKEQQVVLDVFDLNRATIIFENEAELRAILDGLTRSFDAIVYLKNKFEEQWERAEQPPCLHLNLRLKPESLPEELVALLETGGTTSSWIVELQLSMQDFLDVKHRCHAIYEILRLKPEPGGGPVAKLPRGCPVCGLLQQFVPRSHLSQLEDVALGGQRLVKRGTWQGQRVAYNLVGFGSEAQLLNFRKTFLREVGLLTRLEHPNIVQILGVVREPNELGFIAEWVPQGSLHLCLHDPVLSPQLDVWEVALQLCDAIVYLHDNGVVHYDLKSHNVLCSVAGAVGTTPVWSFQGWVVKLGDFGLSRELLSSLHTQVQVGGTPNWQAPETWEAVSAFHSSADVYAFGCLLIELFGHKSRPGCFPWMELTNKNEIKRHVKDLRELPPELEYVEEAKVRAVCTECLAFEAGKRPSMRKVRARLLAAQVDSKLLDPGVRQILTAVDTGRVNFPSLFAKLLATKAYSSGWSHTVSVLEKYSKLGARFQVALALCRHFQSTKAQLQPLVAVCEQHMNELVCAKFVRGWCYEKGVGGAMKDEEKATRHYRQAAAQGYAEAQLRLAMMYFQKAEVEVQKEKALLLKKQAVGLLQQAAKQGHPNAQLNLVKCYQLGEGVEAADHDLAMRWLGEGLNTLKQNNDKSLLLQSKQFEVKDTTLERIVQAGVSYYTGNGVEKDLKEAIRLFRLASDQGLADAQRILGYCYQNGHGVEKDLKEAVKLHRLASDQGLAGAQSNLGYCYQTGLGVRKDLKEAVKLYRLAADQGYALARSNLGNCYLHGLGVGQDLKEAVKLYRLASDQGLARGQFNLGKCYHHGNGVEKDLKEAVKLYRQASNQGFILAQFNLGSCYGNGMGVEKDLKEAAKLYRLASDQGLAQAQFNLAIYCESAQGVEKDLREAARLYRLASNQGLAEAQSNLGVCYENGWGVEKDLREAVRLYRLAADQGIAQAQVNLGVHCQNGGVVDKDLKEAVRLYRLAADQGHAQAQNKLGVFYQTGEGVVKDLKEAARLYRLAADQGHAFAQYNLGLLFGNGLGVEKDLSEAARLYRLAAAQGYAHAQYELGWCYDFGKGVQKDASEAVRFYRLAANQGNAGAQNNLGACYHNGEGVGKNSDEAIRLYRLAAAQGNTNAQANLAHIYGRDLQKAVRRTAQHTTKI